jgi:lysophospholipase L1-like esterase
MLTYLFDHDRHLLNTSTYRCSLTKKPTGWGDGFLQTTLKSGATGTNYGHNGATTVSFRDEGDWATVLAAAKKARSSYEPYVTIQFGHNDQKPEKNISMIAFTANLVKFVKEVKAIPATPILVTSLSRRRFSTSTGNINENLKDVTAAAKDAASKTGAKLIDLNAASTKYLNAIGEDKSVTYNLNPTDFTHLNGQGSTVFGNMVAMLIDEAVPELKQYVVPVKEIATALKNGEYYFPTAA